MQITKEKCAGATNCLDPWFNIMTGAKYFANTLNANNGDLLKSIGSYNGWFTGMTYVCISICFSEPFAYTASSERCHQGCAHWLLPLPKQLGLVRTFLPMKPSGLTYSLLFSLHQFLNGWMMNVDAYMHNPKLGKYFNLNVCK